MNTFLPQLEGKAWIEQKYNCRCNISSHLQRESGFPDFWLPISGKWKGILCWW